MYIFYIFVLEQTILLQKNVNLYLYTVTNVVI